MNSRQREVNVRVDEAKCVGTRMCGVISGDVFVYEPSLGHSRAIVSMARLDDELLRAAEGCPVGAIELLDTVTGEAIRS